MEDGASLVRRHAGRLLRLARRLLRTEDQARAAVREGFRTAFDTIDSRERAATESAWLRGHVVRAAIASSDDGPGVPAAPIERLLPRFDETEHALPPQGPVPELACDRTGVKAALDFLPDPYRTALVLRDVERLDAREAAAHLSIAPRELETRVHRARQALLTLLAGARSA